MIYGAMTAALFSLAISGVAAAQPYAPDSGSGFAISPDIDSRMVRIGPRDLTSPEGARRLALRMRSAAEEVCDGENVLTRSSMAFHDCVQDAVTRAATVLDAPRLTAAVMALGLEGPHAAGSHRSMTEVAVGP